MYWIAWRFVLYVANRPAEAPSSCPVSIAWLFAPATIALDFVD
jgi:hypothetical protein